MRNKFIGCIIGSAIGDALGAPLESLDKETINKKFVQFNIKNSDYVEPLKSSRRAEEGIAKGQWTDDTQLLLPTIWSIIYKGGIHPRDIAEQYAHVFKTEILRGWGRSTIQSVESYISGSPWHEASNNSVGIGNGCAMKAAPLGLVLGYILTIEKSINILHCLNSIIDVGKITHKDIGIRAGLLQAVVIAFILNNQRERRIILRDLKLCESELFGSSTLSSKIERLLRLDTLEEICDTGGLNAKAEDSWTTTIAVYLKTKNDHPIQKLFWLISQGGDADTTGAMLGTLIGAQHGVDVFPQKLRRDLESYSELERSAILLYNLFINLYGEPNIPSNSKYISLKRVFER